MDEMTYDNDGLEPDLIDIAAEIERNRPIPNPGYRGDLGRRLERKAGRMPRITDTVAVRRRIAGMAGSGGLLLAVAGAGLLGLGPLAS